MGISWKDAITTLFIILVIGIYYAKTAGTMELPLISGSYRWAVFAVAVLGVGMCAFSSAASGNGVTPATSFVSGLGILSFAFILLGLITGSSVMFSLLSATIFIMWIISTVRHIFI